MGFEFALREASLRRPRVRAPDPEWASPCPLLGEGTRESGWTERPKEKERRNFAESERAPNDLTRVVRSRDDGVYALDDAGGCRIGASASRLPSRHGGTEPISTPRKRPSGVRILTKPGPSAFPSPSSHIPSASTCLAPASSFCGRSFQTRKTSFRSSSRATEPPGTRVTLYGSDVWSFS
jgi:hypothetical protein